MPACPAGHESSASDFCDVCGMRIGAAAGSGAAGSAPGSGSTPAGAGAAVGADPALPAESCPRCGGTRAGRFCEACGFDFAAGTAPPRRGGLPPATTVAPGAGSAILSAGPANPGTGPAPPATGPANLGAGPADQGTAPGAVRAGAPANGPGWTAVVTADRAYYDRVLAAGGPDAATLGFPAYCPERRFQLTGTEMRIGRRSTSRGLEPEIDLSGPPTDPGVSHLHAVLVAEPDGGWAVLDPGSANGTQVNGGDIPGGVKVPLHSGDQVHVGAWTLLTIIAT
jgi:FHA domain